MTPLQLTPQALQRQQQEIDRCCSLYYIIIGSIYNIAQSAMIDAYTYIRRDPRYRHQTKQDINFNDSPRVTLAYDILIRKLSDPDTYNIASRSALQLNQDICRKYDKQFDQKMQELQQQYENR